LDLGWIENGPALQRIAEAVAMPARRSERARAAADLIRHGTARRCVGIYTVTDS